MKKTASPLVIWLLTGCLLIFTMVIVGGITRLTGSGLSITGWKLIRGTVPPLNEQQWMDEFDNYKKIPQYIEINYHFTLNDFKKIYWWEYIHRLIGRIIGLVFIIPFLFFYIKKQLDKPLVKKLLFIFFLGGLQGFLGWYMVKSGLMQNVRVSHIRLAIHLITAFITFGFTFWVMLGIIYPGENEKSKSGKTLLKISLVIFSLVVLQIIYGAFTAGLKAGHIYNTFPKMGDEWMAASVSYGLQTEGAGSLINNISVVQFIHRCFAWLLALLVFILWYYVKSKSRQDGNLFLPVQQEKSINFLAAAVAVQFLLGVFTLVYQVPIVLGVLHQAGAFILFAASIYLIHSFTSPAAAIQTLRSESGL